MAGNAVPPNTRLSPQARWALLKEVSRSFYITMRVLPRAMREPIALAYLLARATDTLADSETIPAGTRLELLRGLRTAVVAGSPWPVAGEELPLVEHAGEARLLVALPEILQWLRGMNPVDAADVRWVLDVISQGQILDIERFEIGAVPGEVRTLETAAELEDYTYRVAGCVGEFWTRVALRKFPGRYAVGEEAELLRRGVEFGKGLQLVNILRDFPSDLEKGRCYLPAMELRASGVADLGELRERTRRAEQVWTRWVVTARHYLESAREYALSLRSWRMRFACALPIALGRETLRRAEQRVQAGEDLPQGVKVPRTEVKRLMLRLLWASRSEKALRPELATSYQKEL